MAINGDTKVYGIIGWPVGHSLSPAMHNAAFTALRMNRVYVPFPVEDVAAAVAGMRGLGISGASVTIPHKQSVIPYLDAIDPVAAKIGAVNTLERDGNGRIIGSNTDWLGANRALAQGMDMAGKSAVLLGAGGSARAIGFGLMEAGVKVTLVNRTVQKGEALAADLDCPFIPLAEISGLSADILVNATSVGMRPHDGHCPVPVELLDGFRLVMDIVYAPLQTVLLREAAARGCQCVDGLTMLLYQGVSQFELWTGETAPVTVMRDIVYRETGNS